MADFATMLGQTAAAPWSPSSLAELLSPSQIEAANQQGADSPYASLLNQMGYNYVEGGPVPDSAPDPSGWFMGASETGDGAYNDPYANSLSNLYQRYDSETGNYSPDWSYQNALNQLGYIPAGTEGNTMSAQWKTPETLQWFNQNYGTNFTDQMSYLNWLYGPGGTMVNDPNHGQLYRPPEGRGVNDYINQPLSYDPPDTGMFKWAPTIIGAIAGAGLTGMLPGTTSIFGQGGALSGVGDFFGGLDMPWGANSIPSVGLDGLSSLEGFLPGSFELGASGYGGAAGAGLDAAAAEWLASNGMGSMLTGVNPGGLDGALGDSMTGNPMVSGSGSSGINWSSVWDWVKANPNLVGQLGGAVINGLSSWLSSNAQKDAANQANQTLWNMYQQNRTDLAPWREAGVGALNQLVDLTTPGKQLDTAMLDPGYAFRQSEGQRALDASAKAAGRFYSGRQLKDTSEYNQNFATNEFGNVYNRLAGLAGTGQTATSQTGAFGQNAAQGMASNQIGAGNARASGYMGVGNAITGGIGGYLNTMNQQNMLEQLLNSGSFRAFGGPVDSGKPYLVGEFGPEVVVPQQSGYVVPNPATPMGGKPQDRMYGLERAAQVANPNANLGVGSQNMLRNAMPMRGRR